MMTTDIKRRTLLKGTLAASVVGVAAGAGLLTPRAVLAAWPAKAFDAQSVDAAVQALTGSADMASSEQIEIQAPPIAENGAVVGVTVSTTLPDVDSISVLVEANNSPLAASFQMAPATEPFVGTRLKVAETSNIIALVRSGGKLHSTSREVKVTIGGCGG